MREINAQSTEKPQAYFIIATSDDEVRVDESCSYRLSPPLAATPNELPINNIDYALSHLRPEKFEELRKPVKIQNYQ